MLRIYYMGVKAIDESYRVVGMQFVKYNVDITLMNMKQSQKQGNPNTPSFPSRWREKRMIPNSCKYQVLQNASNHRGGKTEDWYKLFALLFPLMQFLETMALFI